MKHSDGGHGATSVRNSDSDSGPGAPIILANPDRARVVIGQRGTYSVKAWSPLPMSYQWQKGGTITNMADIPGATESTYTTPPSATLADSPTLYRCIISNSAANSTTRAR